MAEFCLFPFTLHFTPFYFLLYFAIRFILNIIVLLNLTIRCSTKSYHLTIVLLLFDYKFHIVLFNLYVVFSIKFLS